MLDEITAAPIIDAALHRLSVETRDRTQLAQRVQNVSIMASFFMPPPGQRISPKQIMAALEQIENGVRDISDGLKVIDGARRTTTPSATRRSESLAQVQRGILGAIAEAVLSRIRSCPVTDEQLAESMPEYGYLAFNNSWDGVFEMAARRIEAIRNAFGNDDFRAPTRDRDERFVRAVGQLADIYRDATGREARAYSPGGDATNASWRPPFSQFIVDLWPLLDFPKETVPSDRRIADALVNAAKLPPYGSME